MQVLCKIAKGNAETHCGICGQGFMLFWDRQSRNERVAALHEIQEALRRHHCTISGPEAHPTVGFPVPDWNGSTGLKSVAVSGTALTWGG
jgi:hypothetical protein